MSTGLEYRDEDRTGVEAIEPAQEGPYSQDRGLNLKQQN